MKTMMAGLLGLMLLACAPLHAGEAERENAKAFLAGLTELKDAAKSETTLKFRMLGVSVGSATMKVEHGEYEGKKCYVVTGTGEVKLGESVNTFNTKSYVGADMTLLFEESQESENGELRKSKTYKNAGGVTQVHVIDKNAKSKDDQDRKLEIKGGTGMMLGATDTVVHLLLPRDAGKKYEFEDWSDTADKVYTMTFEVAGEEELYGQKCVRIIEHSKEFTKSDDGFEEKDEVSTQWFAGNKVLRYETSKFVLDSGPEPKRTVISKESLEKQDKEFHGPLLFFMAIAANSEDEVKKAVNLDRFADLAMEKDEGLAGMDAEQKAEVKAMIVGNLPAQFLQGAGSADKPESERKRDMGVMDLLKYEENFVVSKDGDKVVVAFGEDAQKLFGKLSFQVEKNKDNKWQVVWVEQGEKEAAPDEK